MTPSRLWTLIAPLSFGQGFRISKPEDLFGYAVANSLRASAIDGTLDCIFVHVPNEIAGNSSAAPKGGGGYPGNGGMAAKGSPAKGRSAALRYVMARALGLIPGAADLLFLGRDRALAIELKAGKNRASDNQKLFAEWCLHRGVPYHIVTAKDEADIPAAVERVRNILKSEGLLT